MSSLGIRTASVVASLILFSPTSVLLGMVSPYAAKIKLENLNTSGSTIGNLYALSTAGSIAGTFLSGFYLIPRFGTYKLLIILLITLIIVSVALSARQLIKTKIFFALMALFYFGLIGTIHDISEKSGFIDIDTPYNRVFIYDHYDNEVGGNIRAFLIGGAHNSAMFLDKDDLAIEHSKYYHLAIH